MMHTKFFLFIFFLFCKYGVLAQNSAIVSYSYTHDSYAFNESYTLKINGSNSQYIHYQEYQVSYKDGGMEFYTHRDYYDWYYNAADQTITQKKILDKGIPLLATYEANQINWQIHDKTREIAGYKVQKATTKAYNSEGEWGFGTAIAWFAIDLPYSTGPEKYYGLPGLIVYLEFTNRSFTCEMIGIEFNDTEINLPTTGIAVSEDQIENPHKLDKKWLKAEKNKLADE